MSKRENRRIGPGLATDALGNFRHGDRGERRFFRRLPNRGVAADRGQRRVPRPDRDWKIESADHGDNTERMPLLHQTMIGPLRLNRQAIKHARLTNGEIADVDHLLHFAFALRDNFPGLERDELPEIIFVFAQGVAELANGFAANRPGRDAPFLERFVRASDRLVVIVSRSSANAGQHLAIDRRNLFDGGTAAAPFAGKDAIVFVQQDQDY